MLRKQKMVYVSGAGSDMTEKRYVVNAKMSSKEETYLNSLRLMSKDVPSVLLAPSKMLRSVPLVEAPLPLPFNSGIFARKIPSNYDIPWEYIDDCSPLTFFLSLYKYIFVRHSCDKCNRVELIPYVIPKKLRRLSHDMANTGLDFPIHICKADMEIHLISMALPSFKIKKSWGIPSLHEECKSIEIWDSFGVNNLPEVLINSIGIEEDRGYYLHIRQESKEILSTARDRYINVIPPCRISYVSNIINSDYKIRAYDFQPNNNSVYLDIILKAYDIVSAYYLSEIRSSVTRRNKVPIHAHYYYVDIINIELETSQREKVEAFYDPERDKWNQSI